jgi:hypothetical protein
MEPAIAKEDSTIFSDCQAVWKEIVKFLANISIFNA